MNEIPVIDLTPYFDGSGKTAVAQQINRACLDIGFFTIRGHGIPLAVVQRANDAARAFFDLPLAAKQAAMAPGGMGYIGPEGEHLAASLDDKKMLDVKESLNLTLPISEAIWPDLPELQAACGDYYQALLRLAADLMHLFALALDLPEDWFDDKTDDPRTILRLLNYPPVDGKSAEHTRAGAHTDYGTLTILWSPDSRGLQAQNRQGEWVDVIAPAEHFIINIGDLMMNWTNDRWISTLHRVVPRVDTNGRRRQSMAFFHNPNPNATIACIDTCHDASHPPKYQPILAKTHLEMKIAKSLGQAVKL
ncbi:MAG: isopenicillin N synthase family oxygenase [Ardenticatenaceae bacterium]|nr:isopenicillin N synthase family oxygenase [Ardenticatenaceae bacterium]